MMDCKVVKGAGVASQMGFPTINLVGCSLKAGIWHVRTSVGDGVLFVCRRYAELHVVGLAPHCAPGMTVTLETWHPFTDGPAGGLFEVIAKGMEAISGV